MDAVLRQQQQFVEEQRLQNKQIELKRAELQELNVEILRQQNVIKTQQNELAKSAKKKLSLPEVQPTILFEQFNRSITASTQFESSSYAKQPAVFKPTSRHHPCRQNHFSHHNNEREMCFTKNAILISFFIIISSARTSSAASTTPDSSTTATPGFTCNV